MACPAARAEDPASSATPSPAATSSQTLAGLCVSNGMRGTKPPFGGGRVHQDAVQPATGGQAHERLLADVGEPGRAPANAYRPGGVASTTVSAASGWPR